jgi:PAS domain S-box-containing protein
LIYEATLKIPKLRVDLRIPLLYTIFGGLWILFSDTLLASTVTDPAALIRLQTYKGWAFVAASGLVIFLLLRRELRLRRITERKLDESEERYRLLFEHSMDAILLTSPDGSIQAANPAACRMFGRTEDEIIKLGRDGLVDTTDPRLKEGLDERARTGRFHGELTYLRADGTKFEGELTTNIFKDRDGLEYTSMIIRDIAGRKQMDQTLRESRERYKLISSLTSDYMFHTRVDANGHMHHDWVAGAFEGITGYTLEEFVAHGGWRASVHPDDLEADDRDMEKLRAGRRVITEIRTVTKSGGTRWVRVYAQPVLDPESGQLTGIHGAVQEISERKKAEEYLRESEERYRALVQVSPNAIFINRDDRITFINQNGLEMLGASNPDQILGRSPLDFFHPDYHEVIKERIRSLQVEKKPAGVIEEKIVRLDGEIRDVDVTAAPFEYQGAAAIQVIMRDITERKRAERELRLSRDRLKDLSRRLAQAHEAEARAIGRELHDQIGQMLTAMKITLDLAGQLPADAAGKKIEQARDLAGDLLQRVSRLSLELRPPMLDDLGLIPALVWHAAQYQESTGIQVDFKHSGVEGKRFAPEIETAAYRILQEALTNAARHAGADRVRLEVRAGDEWMELRIEDNGSGFDPESALSKNRGLGGMRERAQLVGGTFEIGSVRGEGTKIVIRLPLGEAAI